MKNCDNRIRSACTAMGVTCDRFQDFIYSALHWLSRKGFTLRGHGSLFSVEVTSLGVEIESREPLSVVLAEAVLAANHVITSESERSETWYMSFLGSQGYAITLSFREGVWFAYCTRNHGTWHISGKTMLEAIKGVYDRVCKELEDE